MPEVCVVQGGNVTAFETSQDQGWLEDLQNALSEDDRENPASGANGGNLPLQPPPVRDALRRMMMNGFLLFEFSRRLGLDLSKPFSRVGTENLSSALPVSGGPAGSGPSSNRAPIVPSTSASAPIKPNLGSRRPSTSRSPGMPRMGTRACRPTGIVKPRTTVKGLRLPKVRHERVTGEHEPERSVASVDTVSPQSPAFLRTLSQPEHSNPGRTPSCLDGYRIPKLPKATAVVRPEVPKIEPQSNSERDADIVHGWTEPFLTPDGRSVRAFRRGPDEVLYGWDSSPEPADPSGLDHTRDPFVGCEAPFTRAISYGSANHLVRMRRLVAACGDSTVAARDFLRCLEACGFAFDGKARHVSDETQVNLRERMYPALHEAVYRAIEEVHGSIAANGYLGGPVWMGNNRVPCSAASLAPGVKCPPGPCPNDWVPRDVLPLCCDYLAPSITLYKNEEPPVEEIEATMDQVEENLISTYLEMMGDDYSLDDWERLDLPQI